jgi:Protein of unknown function, DUF547
MMPEFPVPTKTLVAIALACSFSHAFDLSYPRYSRLLQTSVCDGGVAYKSITQSQLDSAAGDFSSLSQQSFDSLPANDRIAFLINLYNYYTIVLIKQHYPLKTGIRDISSPWGKAFVPLFGKKVSLDHIEHDLLRKLFSEPRIHFALVCASESCPALATFAYLGDSLEKQLNAQAESFLTNTSKNRVTRDTAYYSQIFQWYGKDFEKKYGNYASYVSSILGIRPRAVAKFVPYDWSLNEVDKCR